MALTKNLTTPDGKTVTYHRIGKIRLSKPGLPSWFELESYASREDRARPGAYKYRQEYEALIAPAQGRSAAYAALLATPEWADATPDEDTAPAQQPAVPAGSMRWDTQTQAWVPTQSTPSLQESQQLAQADIDNAAGQARLRYITDVPGQQATYQRKEQQAREWVNSGYSGPAPSFIAAEAQALGETPQHVAQQVISLADYWAYVKGPEIEAARIKHKASVRSAATLEAVQAALTAALAELEAL